MTLYTAIHRYYLADQLNGICPLKYLIGTDVIKCKNGCCKINTLHMLMKYTTEEARKKNISTPSRTPIEDDINKYYRKVLGFVLSLSNNPRSESLTWQTHSTYVVKKKKERRDDRLFN